MEQSKSTGRYRYYAKRHRFRGLNFGLNHFTQSRERLSSVSSVCGSSQNLLDPGKLLSLQEDAKSHKISSEVMKHRLYESVVSTSRHRKMSMTVHADHDTEDDFPMFARMAMSMPVTPAISVKASPLHSPTMQRSFFYGMFSREHSPRSKSPVDEACMNADASWKGLASIFKPQPRYVPGAAWNGKVDEDEDNSSSSSRESSVESQIHLQQPPSPKVKPPT